MTESIFLPEWEAGEPTVTPAAVIEHPAAILAAGIDPQAMALGDKFADEIRDNMITDFKKEGDLMVHVSTFAILNGMIYMTYYANPHNVEEHPKYHTARMVCCPLDEPENKTYFDLQAAGSLLDGREVDAVYDTILMHRDEETLYLLWTARVAGNYYRLYRTYHIPTGELGEIRVNRLKVGRTTVDFSFTGIQKAFARENIPIKKMYSDIGIMQKLTTRTENGVTYYYSGAYSGDLNFIIKSADLVTWEYVAQPDFLNESKWENAVYVIGDKCYYFVRQEYCSPYGFLTCYDLEKHTWAKPVLIADCQSRSDFIRYQDRLYLFHAPTDREHLGIVRIDETDPGKSRVILQAKMHESCFYPFIQYGGGRLGLSYTSDRKHIRLSVFDPEKYLI